MSPLPAQDQPVSASHVCRLLLAKVGTEGGRTVNAKGETRRALNLGEFIENELSKSFGFLRLALNDRSAGDVTSAERGELSAQRAYHEALYLFKVLRPHISQAGARRLAIRIREVESAMQEA
jgi:hypothetical protein